MNWLNYRDKAIHFLSNLNKYYSGISKHDLAYYRENKKCGEDEEEFILFLFQGVGLSFDEILNDVLKDVLDMSKSDAESVMSNYTSFKETSNA